LVDLNPNTLVITLTVNGLMPQLNGEMIILARKIKTQLYATYKKIILNKDSDRLKE